MSCAYLIPFSVIDAICSDRESEKLNSNYGRGNSLEKNVKLYGKGFRFPLSLIEDYKFLTWEYQS